MKDHALDVRLADLQQEADILVQKIDAAKADGQDKSAVGELMLKYAGIRGRVDEIHAWKEVAEKGARYGTQVRVDGVWRPKLPVFGSIEKALEAMNSPTGGGIHSAAAVKAAREFRAAEDALNAARAVEGRSPLLSEAERKPFNTTL